MNFENIYFRYNESAGELKEYEKNYEIIGD